MTRSNGLCLTAAPILFLLLLSAGARLMTTAHGSDASLDSAANVRRVAPVPLKIADAKTQHLLEQSVSGQLSALRKKEYVNALKFSDASFRQSTTPENFGRMVAVGYAPMVNSVSAKFQPAQLRESMAAIPATVVAKDGTKTMYLYTLVKRAEGWMIATCQAVGPPPAAKTITDEHEI